ncbi:peptide chain release factor N(5)-glutamine methyltransferase [candidate division GN15 bacterium]|nr:peptide chain release factor N(5)-glutamine methyltransferase [candidate division GN15 bacterium]
MKSLALLIAERVQRLENGGIDDALSEVELILCHLLDCDRLTLYLEGDNRLTEEHLSRAETIIKRRLERYPLQFILGEAWFYGRKFAVSPAVMAPTPETELLVETAIGYVKSYGIERPRILDIGIGSGVIGLTVAAELEEVTVVGLDVSEEALDVARTNVRQFGLSERVELRQSDFFAGVAADERFDLILANPPYISETDYATLPPEVLADPKVSLVGGEDGLTAIRRIIAEAPSYLADGGRIMFEIGYDQSECIPELVAQQSAYESMTIMKDLNDIDRIVILRCDKDTT